MTPTTQILPEALQLPGAIPPLQLAGGVTVGVAVGIGVLVGGGGAAVAEGVNLGDGEGVAVGVEVGVGVVWLPPVIQSQMVVAT